MAIGAVIVLLIIIVGGAYVLTRNSGTPAAAVTTSAATTSVVYNTSGGAPVNSSATLSTTVAPTNLTSTKSNSSGFYAVEVGNSMAYGPYLTNSTGYTLYIDTGDVANSGTSSCTSSCDNVWPPFYPANLTIASGLNTSWFGIINRTGVKSKQVTYRGQPLYFYNGDTKPGAITGNGLGTFVVAEK